MAFGPLTTLRFVKDHPLGARQPIQALTRYLRWQVGSRLSLGPTVVDFVNDARLLVRPGMTGATGNVYVGLHEFEDMAFLLHVLRPEDLFVDVGANVGSYTVLAAKVAGARVIAFEPVEAAFVSLRDNTALNHIEARVDARRVCVGGDNGVVRMTTGLDTVNHVVTSHEDSAASQDVPVVRLDDALVGETPFLMKLDVEGYELEVLKGAAGVFAAPTLQAIIMEINTAGARYGRSDGDLESQVRAFGFSAWAYDPYSRALRPAGAGPSRTGNTIFIRDIEVVRERLRSATAFFVLGTRI